MRLDELIPVLLVQIGLILALSRVMGVLFARFQQPQVMGEMVAGIMLGPSLFGLLAPDVSAAIFPPASVPYLGILSQVGVIFFLFLIGLELDPKLLSNRGHAAVVISHVSIIAPFLLGAGLTLYLYPRVFHNSPDMQFAPVALFMGAAMSITAFPVLARILTERNLHKTKVGAVTITCAAVDDVTAWCMLAFVVGVARADGLGRAMITAALSAVYVLVMFFVVKPFLRRLQAVYDREGRLSQNVIAVIFMLVLASAWTTEKIGIHALFGAFLMGAIMPKGTTFVRDLSEKLEDYTVVFLLPIFFAYTGLKTQIGLLNNAELWFDAALIIAVACLGKFGGSALAARACGLGWRESSAIGVLMNTRGLMELVILNIGRDLGVITPAVFAMMVIMALVTTAMTTPLLQWVYPRRLFGPEIRPMEEAPAAKKKLFSVLIPVADPRSGGPLLRLADMITGPTDDRRVYALHLRRPVDRDAYRAGLDEEAESRVAEQQQTLRPLLAHADQNRIPVEAISFVSREVAEDIARITSERDVDLVLMGFHKPVFGRTILGGTVHRVLSGADADVAIFVDRGFIGAQRVLVPYLGSRHDRLALQIAERLGRNAKAKVTVLHVVPPARGNGKPLDVRGEVDRVFKSPGDDGAEFRVVHDDSPVDVVLREARNYDLIVIGVAEKWGLESHLFGWRSERIAEGYPGSLLIVRKRERPTAVDTPPPSSLRADKAPATPTPQPSAEANVKISSTT